MQTTFGPYRVVGELGRGGMAIVFRAIDQCSQAEVALKLMLPMPREDEARRRRFWREVQALQRLDHPGVVRVVDAGEHQGRCYLAMEFVDGETLEERLHRGGPLSPGQAAELGRQLAKATHAAHEAGIVHRDLKPANVLFDRGGQPKVADFGLARSLDPEASRLTQSGVFVGTPGYCAPEQARGEWETLGPAADVYGIGATLYASLTRVAPIQGDSAAEVFIRTEERAPQPLRELRADVDRDLEAIILRCLEKSPSDRYPSARDLDRALRVYLATPQAARRRRGGGGWVAVAVVAALVVGGAGWWVERERAAPPEASATPAEEPPEASEVLGGDVEIAQPPVGEEDLWGVEGLLRDGAALEALEVCGALLGREPDNPDLWRLRGVILVELGRWSDARVAFERVLEREPDRVEVWGLKAEVLEALGHRAEALALLDRAVLRQPEALALRLQRAAVLEAEGELEGALRDLRAVVEAEGARRAEVWLRLCRLELALGDGAAALSAGHQAVAGGPDDGWAHHALARAYRAEAQLELAARHAERATSLDPRVGAHWSLRGEVAQARGAAEEAEEAFAEAVACDPELGEAWVELGIARAVRGRPGAAEALDQGLHRVSGHARGWFVRGVLHRRAGDREQALACYERSLDLDPDASNTLNSRGNVLMGMGRLEEAEADYTRSLTLEPDSATTWANRAKVRRRRGNPGGAWDDLEESLRCQPGNLEALEERGHWHVSRSGWRAAIDDFTAVLEEQHSREALHNRAVCWSELGQPAQALEDVEALLERAPRDASARSLQARVLLELERPEEAREAAERALQRAPGMLSARFYRGMAHAALGQVAAAREDLQAVVEGLEPSHDKATRARARLAELREDSAP